MLVREKMNLYPIARGCCGLVCKIFGRAQAIGRETSPKLVGCFCVETT